MQVAATERETTASHTQIGSNWLWRRLERAGPARQPAGALRFKRAAAGCPGHPTHGLCGSLGFGLLIVLRNQKEQKGKEIEKKQKKKLYCFKALKTDNESSI